MTTDNRLAAEHVGERLSGFVDGELTQQERQCIGLHCDACETRRNELEKLQAIRQFVAKARLSELDQDVWREFMGDINVRTSRAIGWLLLVGWYFGCDRIWHLRLCVRFIGRFVREIYRRRDLSWIGRALLICVASEIDRAQD